ncbi:MAG: hypothetical protein MUF87_14225 [Anaerolineae bacterium]|nr:hypothetical protein [Anaerolineae bacterium]
MKTPIPFHRVSDVEHLAFQRSPVPYYDQDEHVAAVAELNFSYPLPSLPPCDPTWMETVFLLKE